MKSIVFAQFILFASFSQAISFSDQPVHNDSPSNDAAKATGVLSSLGGCLEISQTIPALRACSIEYFSKNLDEIDRDMILAWLDYPFQMKDPEMCAAEEAADMPIEFIGVSAFALCANYEIADTQHRALFFFTVEEKKLKLRNIKKRASKW